jgi:hypothetical protein
MKWDITRNDEILWTSIKRIKSDAKNVKCRPKKIDFTNNSITLLDAEGDVEVFSFKDLLNDYEQECLDVLKEFRRSSYFANFLLHQYLVLARPGYANDPDTPLYESETLGEVSIQN